MKALVANKPGELILSETDTPVPGEGEVLCRVAYCGLCGTDAGIIAGDISFAKEGKIRYPVRIGHEWSGVVEKLGPGVSGFIPGDRVVSDTSVSCGTCEACRQGHYGLCKNGRAIGTVRDFWDGSFAEYICLPERHLYHLPNAISLRHAALIEPATIALSGLNEIPFINEQSLLISGTGAIGLSAAAIAKTLGAPLVMLSGRQDYKLDIARQMGADVCINVTNQDTADEIFKATGGEGAGAVLETSGNVDALSLTLPIVRPRGTICLLGFYDVPLNGFPVDDFVLKGLRMVGAGGGFGLVVPLIDMMQNRGLDLTPVVTHEVPFDDCIGPIMDYRKDTAKKVKILVEIGGSIG